MTLSTSILNLKHRLLYVIGGATGGLCTGIFLGWTRNSGSVIKSDFQRCVVLAVICFMVSSLAIAAAGKPRLFRAPIWLLIPIFGALLTFVTIVLIPNEIEMRRLRPGVPLRILVASDLRTLIVDTILAVVLDALLALPFMLATHWLSVKLRKHESG